MKGMLVSCEKRFTIIALVWGVLFSFLILPWQGPDEDRHVKMIGAEIRNANLADVMLKEVPLNEHAIRWTPENKIRAKDVLSAMVKPPEYSRGECAPRGISMNAVRHLPATAGIVIGVLLGVPAYWVLTLGKLFSVAFYIVICNIALRMMPLRKELLESVMLMPMCIHQAASLSYDCVLISMSFLFIAYVLHLKFKAVSIKKYDLLILIGILYCIAVAKLPYAMLGMLVFMLPLSKLDISFMGFSVTGEDMRRFRPAILGLIIIALAGIIYIGRDNMWIQLIISSFLNFPRTMWLFVRTGKVWSPDIFQSLIGNFGWLDAPTATWFVAFMTAFIAVMSMTHINKNDTCPYSLRFADRAAMYAAFGLCFYLVTVSMIAFGAEYMGYNSNDWAHRLYEITEIGGLQGRYYMPVLPLLLLPLPKIFEMKERDYKALSTSVYVMSCIYTCGVVACRYWYEVWEVFDNIL